MNISSNRTKTRVYNPSTHKDCIQMLEDKLNESLNKYCVECGKEQPEFISINNGVFLCENCVQNHMNFTKNISTIKKNDLKSLTLNEIQYIYFGGNKNLLSFIRNEFPRLTEFPPNLLYKTEAMKYYRNNLEYSINGGIKPEKPIKDKGYEIIENNYHNTIGNKRDSIYIDYGGIDKVFQTCDNNSYNDKKQNCNLINDLVYNLSTEPNYEINKLTDAMNSINSASCEKAKNNNVICYNQNQINNTSQKIKIKIKINNKKFLNNKKNTSQFKHYASKKELNSCCLDRKTNHIKSNIYKKPIIMDCRNTSVERTTSADFLKKHKTNFSQDKKSKIIKTRNFRNLLNEYCSLPKTSNYHKTFANIEEIPIKLKKYQNGKNVGSEENTLSDLENSENLSAQKEKNEIVKKLLESKKNKNNEAKKIEKKTQRKNIENKLKSIKESIENIKKSARIIETHSLKNIFSPRDNKKVINVLPSIENIINNNITKNEKEENNKNIENNENKEKNLILNPADKCSKKIKEPNNVMRKIEVKKELKQVRSKDFLKKKDTEKVKENENEMSCVIKKVDITKFLASSGRNNNNTKKRIKMTSESREKKKENKKTADFNKNKEQDKKEKPIFSIRNKYKQNKIK